MKTKIDHPGVYLPPPLFYVLIFFISIYIQKIFPLPSMVFEIGVASIFGRLFILAGLAIILPALMKFFKTKNTLIPIRPANSLQTSGIYSISRNPMYLGLLSIYTGMAFFKGNLWTLMLIPFVVLIINYFVILNEERYLVSAFGDDYIEYRKKVRRWV